VYGAAVVSATAFVIGFLVLGLAVVFAAFSGGPKSDLERSRGPSRAGRKAVAIGVGVVVLLTGVVVPAVILVGSDDARSAPGGVELTAAQERGRAVFAERCATCHALRASNAVGRVGPNLDNLRPPKALTLNAIQQGRARGQGQMPAALVDGEEAEEVAEYIEAVAGR
jgi:mono/diheme cytochrome c family protein